MVSFFEFVPGVHAVVLPNDPVFTVVAASEDCLRAGGVRREDLIGRGLFEVFPDSDGLLSGSLRRVIATGREDRMPMRNVLSRPIAGNGKAVEYIIHSAKEVTGNAGAPDGPLTYMNPAVQATRGYRDAFPIRLQQELRLLTEPEKIMETASRLLAEHLEADRCVYTSAGTADMVGRFQPADQPFVVDDIESDPRVANLREIYRRSETAALIAVPLDRDGVPAAQMTVHQKAPRRWRNDEIELAQLVANGCWEATERAGVVQELRKSEERLRLAQRAARTGTFEWLMKEGRIIRTPELEALYGLPEGSFEGELENWKSRLLPEDADRVVAGIEAATARQESEYIYEFRIVQPDGTPRWARGHALFFYDAAGMPERMVGLNIDIDRQKKSEIELRRQWETFDNALSHTPDLIYIVGRDGRFKYANRPLLALWKLRLEEAIGKNFEELGYSAEMGERLQNQVREVVNTKRELRGRTAFTDAGGQTRQYELIYSPVLADNGEVDAIAGTGRDITAQITAEEFVQRDRWRWRELLYRAPAAVALLREPEHKLEWVNASYARLVDRPAAELIGKRLRDALPELDGQAHVALLDGVYQRGEPFVGHELAIQLKRADGSRHNFYINFVYAPTRDDTGEIYGIFVHITDVTDAVAARKRAEESERQFRALVDSAEDHAIIGLDQDGRVVSWNAGAERVLGYGETEIAGQPGAIIFTPEDVESGAPERELEAARQKGHATDERWHVRKDGSRFRGSGTLTPVRDAEGKMTGFVKVFQDRTSEHAARQRLRESEERFRQLADSMPQMVWTAGADGHLDYYNQRWFDFTGLDPTLTSDEMWNRMLHPDDRDICFETWERAIIPGQPFQMEYRLWDRHEDRWRWFIGRALPVYDADGHVEKWFGTCTDIDEQKTTQQAVLQAQKLESIGLLAGGIAHDFNNLLVGIMGGASYALDSLPPSHEAYPMLEGIVEASERAAHLTRQMLAYAGKGRFLIEAVDLSEMALKTAELLRASIPKSVQIQFELDERLPTVHTDPGQMQQVMMNLIINGAEAVGENARGEVVVRTRVEEVAPDQQRRDVSGNRILPGSYAVLEVQDTGCGIDAATLNKIFDPFFSTKFTGRGLGLAAVIGIVRSHQGAIEVKTEPGQGSTFRVLLPGRHWSEMTTPAAAPLKAVQPAFPGSEKVLIIDDEPIVRNFAQAALRRLGYEAIVVSSGEQAIDYIRANVDIALALLDMSMPGISGRQVLEELRTIRPSLPVVICSGYSEDEVYRQFSGLEMAGVLQKPFTTAVLVAKVRSVLDS